MIIKYESGCMVVTHDSGHNDSYTIQQLNEFKDKLEQQIDVLQTTVDEFNNKVDLAKASLSI